MKLVIDPSERWLILGKTGSGKTEWAKYMLRIVSQKMPVVIIDPKRYWLGKFPQWEKDRRMPGTVDKPHLVEKFNLKFRVQCLQTREKDDPKLEALCREVLKRGNIFIYFDETANIATATHVPDFIEDLWKMGRAKAVGAWVSTQVPSGIPRLFKSQAEKFVVMRVGKQDIDLAAELAEAEKEEVRSLKRFEWLYYDTDMDGAEWQPPIPYKERRKV
jgi:DNA helicase HerA-like ATPase